MNPIRVGVLRRPLRLALAVAVAFAVLARVFESYLSPEHLVEWLLAVSLCA